MNSSQIEIFTKIQIVLWKFEMNSSGIEIFTNLQIVFVKIWNELKSARKFLQNYE